MKGYVNRALCNVSFSSAINGITAVCKYDVAQLSAHLIPMKSCMIHCRSQKLFSRTNYQNAAGMLHVGQSLGQPVGTTIVPIVERMLQVSYNTTIALPESLQTLCDCAHPAAWTGQANPTDPITAISFMALCMAELSAPCLAARAADAAGA